ncbi:hypothetical protein [Thermoactinospora rubra]|uniref:hypothetical protein n=1 Tax=Thermoactinospora rubra TaxID=1088767 RepID=UPI000A10643F|nr:hypothetical protein [Thermoactinospora rubra]
MARFKNVSGEDRRVGRVDGPLVKADEVATVDGEVTEELEDAYVVGSGDEARAWPKATWLLLDEPKKKGD